MTLNTLTTPPYLEAARRILGELDSRDFTTNDPSKAEGLVECMAHLIKTTMEGNLVVGGDDWIQRFFDEAGIQRCSPEIEEELRQLPEANGWGGDLQHQIA